MRSITVKLILGFLVIGLVSIIIVVGLARWNTTNEFQRFVLNRDQNSFITTLTNYYQTNGSWNGVDRIFASDTASPIFAPPFLLADTSGVVIFNHDRHRTDTQVTPEELETSTPVAVNGTVVGYLIMGRPTFEGDPHAQEFIERTNSVLLYSAIGAVAIALLLGIFLSRTLTRPLRELTHATHAIAQGNFEQQVTIRSHDELGELAAAFNKMSAELSRSINARKQMTADIAHELRTPLSLILGHAEGVHDGVLEPNTENFEIIREEALRLEHLIDDLRTLSLADAGELAVVPQTISPQRLLEEVATLYRYHTQAKNISLELDNASPLPTIEADPGRLTQVLTNLLDNALRHTPEGGRITLASRATPRGVALSVHDSGPGLPPADLERIFDRFYRADASRVRHAGGSGLGLAIAKSIVQAHGGTIRAESEPGNGLTVVITLPGNS